MSIDEAIQHCEEMALCTKNSECGEEHRQLEEWLRELKRLRAEPVRHGRWIDSLARITPYCSACGHSHRCLIRTPNYCPNCGAKMDDYTNSTKIYDE